LGIVLYIEADFGQAGMIFSMIDNLILMGYNERPYKTCLIIYTQELVSLIISKPSCRFPAQLRMKSAEGALEHPSDAYFQDKPSCRRCGTT